MGRLFGTDGVRGVVNEELTPELALRLGEAVGTWLGPDKRVLVGRDVRAGGEMIRNAVVAGLRSAGVEVWDAGLAPTPAIQYATKKLGYDGAVIITASHNPPQYNGIKVMAGDGVEIPRSAEREIEEIFFESRFRRLGWKELSGSVGREDRVLKTYVDGIVGLVDREAIASWGFKVLVDPANSVGALALPQVLRRLGVRVVTLNGHLDPAFPGREPEPTVESLSETARVTVAVGADLAVGTDGDADRSIFIDEKGNIHWGDRSAALLAGHLAEKEPGAPRRVYTAVSSSGLVEEYLKPMGIDVVWMKVGSVDISRRLMEEGGLCGFEENGGFMYPRHHPVRDAAMTTALMLEMMADEEEAASKLFDRLPKYYPLKTKVPMTRDKALRAVNLVREKYSDHRQVTIDGVRVVGEDYWFLVRPSGTEPVLRIMVEAKSPDRAKRIAEELKALVMKA